MGEKIIPNFNLEHLQKLFGVDLENPMYDCYLVEFTDFSSDFEVQVMSIQKTLFRHEELLVEIFVESPNREEIKKLVNALREHNPDAIKPSTNS